MRYKLVAGQNPFDLNPGLLAIEEFKNLTDRQMFYVILVADTEWDNPIKTFPERQRREKAAVLAGYKMEPDGDRPDKNLRDIVNGKVDSVEKAIAKYQELYFDEDEANLAAIKQQIHEAREFMVMDKAKATKKDYEKALNLAEKAVKLGQSVNKLVETRDIIEARIKQKNPIIVDVVVDKTVELPLDDDNDEEEEQSTIDKYMSKDGSSQTN